jgi:hypothetical protein
MDQDYRVERKVKNYYRVILNQFLGKEAEYPNFKLKKLTVKIQ